MTDFLPIALTLALLVGLVAGPQLGWRRFTIALFLILAVLAPWAIYLESSPPTHFGIAAARPIATTYGVALILAALLLARRPRAGFFPFLYLACSAVFLLVGLLAVWGGHPEQWMGAFHFLTAGLAFVVGAEVTANGPPAIKTQRLMAVGLLVLLLVELAFCLLQVAGLPISIYKEVVYFSAEGRPIGTFNHPSTLGKIVLLLLILILPLTASSDTIVRRVGWSAVLVGLIATALTQSRANTIAVVLAAVLWVLVSRRTEITSGRKVAFAIGLIAISVPALALALERFTIDADGGDRPEILATGLAQIASNPLAGTGPNFYVEVVGQYDRLAAAGFPVHNTLLLAVAELGAPGATLLVLAPVIATIILTLRYRNTVGWGGQMSRAHLCALPGIVLVATTGWGLLSSSTLVVWFFVLGAALGATRSAGIIDLLRSTNRTTESLSNFSR